MTTTDYPSVLEALTAGGKLTPQWLPAFRALPRHQFVPGQVWQWATREYTTLDCALDPQEWWALVHSDRDIVAQLDDGQADGPRREPTSTCPAPSVVAAMLRELDPQPGDNVLEVGTGTGWTAALLAHRLGEQMVTSIEIDPQLTVRAADTLAVVGLAPQVLWHDGERGWGRNSPYDRVIASCAVRTVPEAWLRQTRPGGAVLAALHNPFGLDGLVRLTVDDYHHASGRFVGAARLGLTRRQRSLTAPPVIRGSARAGRTHLRPRQMSHGFALYVHSQQPELHRFASRIGGLPCTVIHDHRSSCATIDTEGRTAEYGPRDLWQEIEQLWREYVGHGAPGLGRFGLTVTPAGQGLWLWDRARMVSPP